MAPEVMARTGHDFSADIWSFGITAIEIALGDAPYSNLPAGKIMLNILNNDPPSLPEGGKWDSNFIKMVNSCL
jgi:serine/threonine protein kinase